STFWPDASTAPCAWLPCSSGESAPNWLATISRILRHQRSSNGRETKPCRRQSCFRRDLGGQPKNSGGSWKVYGDGSAARRTRTAPSDSLVARCPCSGSRQFGHFLFPRHPRRFAAVAKPLFARNLHYRHRALVALGTVPVATALENTARDIWRSHRVHRVP